MAKLAMSSLCRTGLATALLLMLPVAGTSVERRTRPTVPPPSDVTHDPIGMERDTIALNLPRCEGVKFSELPWHDRVHRGDEARQRDNTFTMTVRAAGVTGYSAAANALLGDLVAWATASPEVQRKALLAAKGYLNPSPMKAKWSRTRIDGIVRICSYDGQVIARYDTNADMRTRRNKLRKFKK